MCMCANRNELLELINIKIRRHCSSTLHPSVVSHLTFNKVKRSPRPAGPRGFWRDRFPLCAWSCTRAVFIEFLKNLKLLSASWPPLCYFPLGYSASHHCRSECKWGFGPIAETHQISHVLCMLFSSCPSVSSLTLITL